MHGLLHPDPACGDVRILLVDDEPGKRDALASVLEGPGVELVKAEDADQALRLLLGGGDFALILLDVVLPGMDGFELAALIRGRPGLSDLPILFISAYLPDEVHLSKGYSLGAVDYIFSPIIPQVLKAKVNVFVELHRKTRLIRAQAEELESKVRTRTAALLESEERSRAERELARKAIEQREERFRWLVENSSELIWRMEMEEPVPVDLPVEDQIERFYRHGVLAECNDAMARLYGKESARDILGFRLPELLSRSLPRNRAMLEAFVRSGYRLMDAESQIDRRDRAERYMLNNMVGLVQDGRLEAAWGTSRDITDRRRAEEEVRRSRDQLEIILENIADAIMVLDAGGAVVFLNDAAARLLDFPSATEAMEAARSGDPRRLTGRLDIRDEDGVPIPPDRVPIALALQGRDVPPTLLRYRTGRRDGDRWAITRAKPIRDGQGHPRLAVSIVQDVTDIRRAEEQSRQSQKMEAIGRLAGGVAHDFNNLLTAINGYSDLLLAGLSPEDGSRSYVEEIRKSGERAASLTRQLLAYSRKQILTPRVLRLGEIIRQMEGLVRRLIGEDLDFVAALDPEAGRICADQGQVEQVILNLVVNARDAMPDGGKLTIGTGNAEVRPDFIAVDASLRPGKYVVLSVTDTGMGMDEEVKSRLFEPFFTTKGQSQGTGLGLSTVYGIVSQSGGAVTVHSEPGKGATFKVYFPAAAGAEDSVPAPQPGEEGPAPRGDETILVVEDEDAVRRLVVNVLSGLGYRVLQASEGMEALEAARGHAGGIDLLLTDVVMARMGGRELASRIRLLKPSIRVAYMSGYTEDAIVRHGVLDAEAHFLQKPFSPGALARRIREVLDGRSARTAISGARGRGGSGCGEG
jgi:signal transduction histidine kinase/DNA-binding response OmpR family regulator